MQIILETTAAQKEEIDAMEEDEAVRILDARKEEVRLPLWLCISFCLSKCGY